MKKVAIVYWSGTGNTEAMANAAAEGAREAGAEAELIPVSEFSADYVADYDAIGFGCPAMGGEVLEEDEFEPVFLACEPELQGKDIALFGSYGWGGGEWMENWTERCRTDGANIVCSGVTCCEFPNSEAINACRALGSALA